MDFQTIIMKLNEYWSEQGCVIGTPYHTEVGAGTMNPLTFFRSLDESDWKVAYFEPSIRPTDGRYAQNPNRLQHYFQYQVIIKPTPDEIQDIYIHSLQHLGIDLHKHDLRFVEDNWESPSLGAWGVGWEVWLDGMEITQFTYFQLMGGIELKKVPVEITYGIERIAMFVQDKNKIWDIKWKNDIHYKDIYYISEIQFCYYNMDKANIENLRKLYEIYYDEAQKLISENLYYPAYDYVLKLSHVFNLLDARNAIGPIERAKKLIDIRNLAKKCAQLYLADTESQTITNKILEKLNIPAS
ncbi:MAG: glycine--tRNA ligase subunit alpha [Candidatus Calescibacterium sp.]|nr:glycine--tRNA ligase subunit alpha [Candidatus Calescibacterium sp.]MCX7972234.1 glycine--tRNA ligase subunit alpha [bacterium]MDW8195165.1 glycine--tRNA ligase subunit alpha [Candidatus Calescibacterium sp.]